MRAWPFSHPAPPQPGTGMRLVRYSGLGFSISAQPSGAQFGHPWAPFLGPGGVRLARGRVETFEPVINGVPMAGDDRRPAPTLRLDKVKPTAAGESWVCLEVEPDEHGLLTAKSRIEIVHTITPLSHALTLGRTALALILWQNGKPLRAVPIVFFNLRYTRVLPPPGGGAVRHFFL